MKTRWTLVESRDAGEDEIVIRAKHFRTKKAAIRAVRGALQETWGDRITLDGQVTATFKKGGETEIYQYAKSRRREISPKRLLGDLRGLPPFKRAKPFKAEPFEVSRD
jgi:hypothetical protein